MARPGEIEFLDAEPSAPDGEDELDGSRRLPVWVIAMTVLALAGIAAAAVAAARGHHPSHSAAAETPTVAPALPHPPVAGLVSQGSVRLPGSTKAVDIAMSGGHLYVLQNDRLTVVDPTNLSILGTMNIFDRTFAAGRDHVLADAAHDRLWLVRSTDGASVSSVDVTTLRGESTATVHGDIKATAALDGRLFFSTSDGVYTFDGASVTRVHPFDGQVAMAADPTRHRLLVLVSGRPAGSVVALTPSGRETALAQTTVVGGGLGVVGSTVYETGADGRSAVVRTLDPRTLRPVTNLAIAAQLRPGAKIAAIGTRSIWLRSTGANRDVLWCHDNGEGPLAFWWTLTGTIASDGGSAFVLDDVGFVRPVDLISGCSG